MAIPAGVILIWTGTNATIPTGWSRETTLDDKFPKAWGAAVAPNQTGGAATHTHTSPGHTHALASHTHTGSYANPIFRDTVLKKQNGSNFPAGHTHSFTTDAPNSTTSSSTAVTYAAASNEPPYYTVIFIKPSSTVGIIQTGICSHYYGSSAPIGWYYCDGANSTADLRNKYLKGATTGANAGTTGGGTTNVHSITHGHTLAAHTHTFTTDTYSGNAILASTTWGMMTSPHNHTGTSGNSSADTITDNSDNLTTSETVEPAYKKLGVIKNAGGSLKKGMVGLWLGSVATVPNNWVICDGNNGTHDLRDKFVKVGAALANNNEIGGSNTHTHTAQGHTHTGLSHTHSLPRVYHIDGTGNAADGNENHPLFADTYHEAVTSSATAISLTSANTTADSSDNQPAYRTAAYIQLNKLDAGGGFFFNLL